MSVTLYVFSVKHYLGNDHEFKKLCDGLYKKKWITYIKSPFGGPEQVLEYLGRYTHRVAISNNRILKLEDGKVTFHYRDYQDGNKMYKIRTKYNNIIKVGKSPLIEYP